MGSGSASSLDSRLRVFLRVLLRDEPSSRRVAIDAHSLCLLLRHQVDIGGWLTRLKSRPRPCIGLALWGGLREPAMRCWTFPCDCQ